VVRECRLPQHHREDRTGRALDVLLSVVPAMSVSGAKADEIPLLIEFARGTSVYREPDRISDLPIVRNGPPGTFVLFPDGLCVSLPTDQIVTADDTSGRARVGFGGMEFTGLRDGRLTFLRVRELHREERLSPQPEPPHDPRTAMGRQCRRARPNRVAVRGLSAVHNVVSGFSRRGGSA
jgi:hypothetical protein